MSHERPATVAELCAPLTLLPGQLYARDFESCAALSNLASEPVPTAIAGDAPNGPRVAVIDPDGTALGGAYYSSWLEPIAVVPGQTYCLDVQARWQGRGLTFGIRRFDERQVDLGRENVLVGPAGVMDPETGPVTPVAADASGWQRLLRTFQAPADTHHLQLFVNVDPSFGPFPTEAAAQVDDVQLWKGACASREAPICRAADSARGLLAEYFDDIAFTTPKLTRLDGPIGFEWAIGSPHALIAPDTFSVRWTGFVQPRFTETYTFITRSDDGVRLTVDGQPIIERWNDHAVTEDSGTIALEAGLKVPVTLEMYENAGRATLQLFWRSARRARELVPRSRLFPTAEGCVSSGTLLGHWAFDDGMGSTASDSTCAGNHGALRELGASPWQPGRAGRALALDGAAGWVRVADSPSVDDVATTNAMTIGGWVRLARTQAGWAAVASRQTGTSGHESWGLAFADGKRTFIVNSDEPGTHRCSAPTVAPTGRWLHVAGTFDGRWARAYLDGVEVCSFERPVRLRPDITPVILGGNANTAADDAQELLAGLLDGPRPGGAVGACTALRGCTPGRSTSGSRGEPRARSRAPARSCSIGYSRGGPTAGGWTRACR